MICIFSGTGEEHIDYCFDIYDLNNDGFISREEMLNMMKTALGRQGLEEDQDEGVKVRLILLLTQTKVQGRFFSQRISDCC